MRRERRTGIRASTVPFPICTYSMPGRCSTIRPVVRAYTPVGSPCGASRSTGVAAANHDEIHSTSTRQFRGLHPLIGCHLSKHFQPAIHLLQSSLSVPTTIEFLSSGCIPDCFFADIERVIVGIVELVVHLGYDLSPV